MCKHGFRKGKNDLAMDKTVNFEIRVLVHVHVHGETISLTLWTQLIVFW